MKNVVNDTSNQGPASAPADIPILAIAAVWIGPAFWFVFQILVLDKSAVQAALSPITLFGLAAAVVLTTLRTLSIRSASAE